MYRVADIKLVKQCAVLQDWGMFLVLADKSLFAYPIETLVPSSSQDTDLSPPNSKLNGTKEVEFFRVGIIDGRTLVIYLKKKGVRWSGSSLINLLL